MDNGRENYVIGVIYRHPGSSVECMDDFTMQLETLMAKINNENKKCILSDDINVDGLKIDKNEHVKFFFDTVLQNDFIPTITLPTRIVEGSVSLLNHILINTKIIKNDCNIITGNIYCGITDHLPNFIIISEKDKFNKPERPLIRIFGTTNMTKFKEMISNASWEDFHKTTDPNHALSTFYKIYHNVYNKCFPLTKDLMIKNG